MHFCAALESLLAHDPAQRGLTRVRWRGSPLGEGNLARAAESFMQRPLAVAIVTGFCVPDGPQTAAETDGPPGALYLARALAALGAEVTLISDCYALPLLDAGVEHWRLGHVSVCEFPFDDAKSAESKCQLWVDTFLTSDRGRRLTHLIAVERAGPSHTPESLASQSREGAAPLDAFSAAVPPEAHNVCHNMRGTSIDALTAPTHLLFDAVAARQLPVTTIAMADGGNEIGMGSFPWEVLAPAIAGGWGSRIACRVPAQHTLVAGVSNWAAYALAESIAARSGSGDLAADWRLEDQRELIEMLARDVGAVDGVTRQRTATVDGIPLAAYLGVLADIQRAARGGAAR